MRDFHQFLQNKTEGFFGFGSKKWRLPEPIDPRFDTYWRQLVLRHGGEEAAWPEYQQLKSTPAGQYKMMRVNARLDPRATPDDTTASHMSVTHPTKNVTQDDFKSNQLRARTLNLLHNNPQQ